MDDQGTYVGTVVNPWYVRGCNESAVSNSCESIEFDNTLRSSKTTRILLRMINGGCMIRTASGHHHDNVRPRNPWLLDPEIRQVLRFATLSNLVIIRCNNAVKRNNIRT